MTAHRRGAAGGVAADLVHVWVMPVDACIAAHGEPALVELLDAGERAECGRARQDRVRRERLVSRALRRVALSWLADRPATSWTFTVNAFDRPELVPTPGVPPIRFNVSHSGGLVACATALAHDVGVDVEDVTRRVFDLVAISGYLAPSENEHVVAQPAATRARTFFRYWTLKEAYAKARGMGLAVGFDSFEMDLGGSIPCLSTGPERSAWRFEQWDVGDSHVVALAVHAEANEPLRIVLTRLDDLNPIP